MPTTVPSVGDGNVSSLKSERSGQAMGIPGVARFPKTQCVNRSEYDGVCYLVPLT